MKTSLIVLCIAFVVVGCAKKHVSHPQVNKSDRAMYQKFLSSKAHQELSKEVEKLEK